MFNWHNQPVMRGEPLSEEKRQRRIGGLEAWLASRKHSYDHRGGFITSHFPANDCTACLIERRIAALKEGATR